MARSLTRACTSRRSASSPPLLQAGAGQYAELDFRHVQPTSVLGGVVELQPLRNPPGLWRRERLVQGRRTVRVQVVHDHPHHGGLRVSFVHQPTHLMGEVLHRAPLGHRHVTPARQRLTGQEQVADALPPVLVVLPQRNSGPGRQRWPRLGQQLGLGLVKADHRPSGVIRFVVQVQHVLHVGHELGAHLGDAPFLLLPRLESVFLSRWRTPSWDMEDANPNSTTFPASRRRVQRSCPSGAGLHSDQSLPRTGYGVRLAPVIQLPVPVGLAPGRALSNPSPAKRCLIRYTVPRVRASATWGAAHRSLLSESGLPHRRPTPNVR